MKNTRIDPSLFDQFKTGNFSGMMQTIKDAHVDWPVAAIFLGSGFLSGFLFKRYYKMFIISVAVGLVLVWALDRFFHVIDWRAIDTLLGDAPATHVETFFESVSSWIAHNVVFAVSFAIGGVLGIFI